MPLILDSSVVIDAGRWGGTVERLIERVAAVASDPQAALSAVGADGLVHGLYRANSSVLRLPCQPFLDGLLADLTVYPLSSPSSFSTDEYSPSASTSRSRASHQAGFARLAAPRDSQESP
jgi:hypothetical protein